MRSTIFFAAFLVTFLSFAQNSMFDENEVAFDGYDLVTYFTKDKPAKGIKQHSVTHDGHLLYFSTEANKKKFISDPQQYMPAYDGWCAIALTQNSYVRPSFDHYKVQEGELLFFEVRAFFNGLTAWEKNPEVYKILADKKYRDLESKN
jgi:YHS domain-containing protein